MAGHLSLSRLAFWLAFSGLSSVIAAPVSDSIDSKWKTMAEDLAKYHESQHSSPTLNISKILVGPNIPLIGDPSGEAYKASSEPDDSENDHGRLRKRFVFLPAVVPQTDSRVTLINSTPYRWRRGYTHSYQIKGWDEWPDYIEPGQSFKLESARTGSHTSDCAAEVAYHLEGTEEPMSFMVKRLKKGGLVRVEFLEELEANGNPKGSEIALESEFIPPSSNFILSGMEGDFYSCDPPARWMQTLLPELGQVPLREIVMPRSHHAGFYRGGPYIWSGNAGNTITQSEALPFQLSQGGVRVLDVRPMHINGKFYESHGAWALGNWNGGMGANLMNMINDANRWQKENPGELIIWDFHEVGLTETGHDRYADMTAWERNLLYQMLKLIRNRIELPDDEDITKFPLEHFIGNNTSASIIRIHHSWLEMEGSEDFPGGAEGFVSHNNFPFSHRWSNMNSGRKMAADQIKFLKEYRPTRDSKLHNSDWLLTQKGTQVLGFERDIKYMNYPAYDRLYEELWNAVTDETYPNWITMDNIHSPELKAITMAMNHCLVAQKCGDLGGKVTALAARK